MNNFISNFQRFFKRMGQRIAHVGAIVVSPIENLFSTAGRKVVSASDQMNRVEDGLLGLGRWLLWPFRMLWNFAAAVGTRILPGWLRNAATSPFVWLGKLFRSTGRLVMRGAEALNLDGMVLWFVWLLQPLWRPFAMLGGFLHAWSATRDYKQALWGLPAILLLLPFAFVLGHTLYFGTGSIAAQYRIALDDALKEGKYEEAKLYENKLIQLGKDTNKSAFIAAESFANKGKWREALKQMQKLAPEETPGYPNAHFWILANATRKELGLSEKESLRLIDVHLNQLDKLGFNNPGIQLIRAKWLVQSKKYKEAAKLLAPLVSKNIEAAILRMDLHAGPLKDIGKAKVDAQNVLQHFNERERKGKPLNEPLYQAWVKAESLRGNSRKVERITKAWHRQFPESKPAKKILASIKRVQFDQLLRSKNPDSAQLANLLSQAEKLYSDPNWAEKRIAFLYSKPDKRPTLHAMCEVFARDVKTPSSIIFSIGALSASNKDWEIAKTFLPLATVKDPTNAVSWNNYAWFLSNGPNANQQKALEMVQKAAKLAPDDPRVRETRGQIFAKLKRWKEAIVDLEFASNGIANANEIHQTLAKAYEALGKKDLASFHKKMSE